MRWISGAQKSLTAQAGRAARGSTAPAGAQVVRSSDSKMGKASGALPEVQTIT